MTEVILKQLTSVSLHFSYIQIWFHDAKTFLSSACLLIWPRYSPNFTKREGRLPCSHELVPVLSQLIHSTPSHKLQYYLIFCWPCILLWSLVNDQLEAQFFSMYLFQFSTCFEQRRAHHQENQLYQYNIWYMSLCVGDRFVCRSEGNFGHLPKIITRCTVNKIQNFGSMHFCTG
jgi:hypothetical protein